MSDYLTVGQAGPRLGVHPRVLSQGFYDRWFRDDLCPVVSGRRLIPSNYLPTMASILRRRGVEVRETSGETQQ